MNFIPADESSFFQQIFRVYVKWLFKRRFKNVWVHQEYHPSDEDRTVYFLNHTSWWDGLIPFLLNEYCFKQQGRAMMEYKQMRAYPFFKYLGAFSIMPHNRSHNLSSLRYAVQSMDRPHAALFVYPEGEIVPAGSEKKFKRGIGWLHAQLPTVDFVPIGIHIHTIRSDKPELHLWIDEKVSLSSAADLSEATNSCEEVMEQVLGKLKKTAGFQNKGYSKFI